MAFQVMHAENGNIQREAERGGYACADQQRARQPRSLRVGYGAEIPEFLSGLGQALLQERQHAPYMIAGCEFRHHAAIFAVHFRLGIKRMAQQPALGMVKRNPCFVAGCFDSEYKQGWLDRRDQQGACG